MKIIITAIITLGLTITIFSEPITVGLDVINAKRACQVVYTTCRAKIVPVTVMDTDIRIRYEEIEDSQ